MKVIPYYKKHILGLLLLVVCLPLHAQVNRALRQIEEDKFDGVESFLRTSLSDGKEEALAYYGLARLYLDTSYVAHQLDSSYQFVELAQTAFKALGYKEKGKIAKDLSSTIIRKQRTAILKAALEKAQTEDTQEAYQHFIDHYPGSGSRYEGKAITARNKLAYAAASTTNTELAFTTLLDTYGADLKAKNADLYEAAQKQQLELYLKDEGWEGYPAFAEQYPDHLLVKDSLFESFKALWSGPVVGFNEFIKTYPTAPITSYAIDSLAGRLSHKSDTLLSSQFVAAYPDHPQQKEVYGIWYEDLRKGFNGRKDLERFKTAHPDFPFPEKLEADEAIFLERSYEKLQVGKALGAFRIFLDQYPDYGKIDTVWLRYYLSFKQELPGIKNLANFNKVHPEFPFPELLAADREKLLAEAHTALWEKVKTGEGTAGLFKFIEKHKKSLYLSEATDLLGERLLEDGHRLSIKGFLKEYPEHELKPKLLKKLWEVFPDKDHREAVADFIKDYPDFPEPELLTKALTSVPLSDREALKFTEDKRSAFPDYIRSNAPEQKAFDALWSMLEADFSKQNWDSIYQVLRSFKEDFGEDHLEYSEWLTAFSPKNRKKATGISPAINTDLEEFSAVITADDQTIYFCRNMPNEKGDRNEDIYMAQRDEAGNWGEAQVIEELLTDRHEAPEAISADGNRMLVFKDAKIYTSEKTKTGWSEPKIMSHNINRTGWQADAGITADGKAIIFTSMAETKERQRDIYVSLLQEDGSWGPATSLGDSINTKKNDRGAFLHPDMKTLYFSSRGHKGLGGFDIYVSKRLDDSWTNWSKPVNLGPGINTINDDWNFKVTTDGQQAYFNVLADDGTGDIFITPLAKVFRPEPVATVSGKLSSIDGDPIGTEINWTNLETGVIVQSTASDPGDGTFFATLPSIGKYGYTIVKKGYFPVSGNLDFTEKLYHKRLDKEMTIVTLEEMKAKDLAVPLNNLFFESAKYEIKPESFPELNGLTAWVKEYDLVIEVHGHTDIVGDEAANLVLSENRAKAVRTYLIEKGLDPEKVIAKGFGQNKPVAVNDTVEGRAQNRRVEIKIAKDN